MNAKTSLYKSSIDFWQILLYSSIPEKKISKWLKAHLTVKKLINEQDASSTYTSISQHEILLQPN